MTDMSVATGGHELLIRPRRRLIPYAGMELPPALLPPGTLIDGFDCTGMTDDPKKIGTPVYCQCQNRRLLDPRQQAVADAALKVLRVQERAERQALKGPCSTGADMRRSGAKLRTRTARPAVAAGKAPGAPRKAAGAVPAKKAAKHGSKLHAVAALLKRAKGCTAAECMAATGWPSISMPAMAKAAGLKLKKVKEKGEPTRYWGS
jgi:hypothetical protein